MCARARRSTIVNPVSNRGRASSGSASRCRVQANVCTKLPIRIARSHASASPLPRETIQHDDLHAANLFAHHGRLRDAYLEP